MTHSTILPFSIEPWFQKQWDQWVQQKNCHRFPQALLLQGNPEVGLGQLSSQLAQFLLCRAENGMPCGVCRDCVLFSARSHPDYFELIPEAEGKAIKVDMVRTLIERLSQTAQRNALQVVRIQPADQLNLAAANALLKTLEEPAGDVIFILVAEERGKLPLTVTSRCQQLFFHAPDPALGDREVRTQIFQSLLALPQAIVTQVADAWSEFPSDTLLHILFSIMMDVLRIKNHVPIEACAHQEQAKAVQSLAATFSTETIWKFLEALKKMRAYALKGLNVHFDLMLYVALFDLKLGA